jgi:hypothetical protein
MLAPGVTDPTRAAAQMISAQERSASSTTGVAISTDQVTDRARCGSGVMCALRLPKLLFVAARVAFGTWHHQETQEKPREGDRETERQRNFKLFYIVF